MKFLSKSLLILFGLSANIAVAQDSVLTRLAERFANRDMNSPSATLFLHLDKTLYTNNETIWFAAYLQNNRGTPLAQHHTLSVALVHTWSGKVNLSELYVMQDGLSSGSMVLPDTIAPGNYQLLAYTNVVDKGGMPFEVFSQPLTIKSTIESKFQATLRLLDTAQSMSGQRRLAVQVSGLPLDKKAAYKPATVSYYTAAGGAKTVETDGKGQAIISIGDTALSPLNNTLYVRVSYDKQLRYLNMALPVDNAKKLNIKFYPEGGNLSANIGSRIGIEASSAYGQPVSLRGVIEQDGKGIDTVETTSSGMGSFKLIPQEGSSYGLRIGDTVYELPKAIKGLPVMSLERALVQDTLSFAIKSLREQSYTVLLHNTHELFASFMVRVNARGRNVKVALADVPKGIAAVTVLDSLGRPLIERLFFAHYTSEEQLIAQTDKQTYKPREQVSLKLRLKELMPKAEEQAAIVSVSVVQENRIQTAKFRDMESYTYLEHELGSLPVEANGKPYYNRSYLEELLLVKGWRRFVFEPGSWPQAVDTSKLYHSLELSGRVTKNGKALEKGISLTVLRDTLVDIVKTDDRGNMELNRENLMIEAGKKVHFTVNVPYKDPYKITIDAPYDAINERLSGELSFGLSIPGLTVTSALDNNYRANDKQIQLQAVEIKGGNDDSLYGRSGGANKCGDWVCLYNFLNCLIHPPGTPGTALPEKGRTYRTHKTLPGGIPIDGSIVYQGCVLDDKQSIFQSFSGIKVAKEFYVNDFQIDKSESYQSTLFWAPFIQLNSSKDTELSFYTSDLKAPYRLVVQGISEKQVVTAAATFKVE